MIRINLASSIGGTAAASPTSGELPASDIQRQGAIRLVIIMLVPFAMYAYELQSLPDLRSRLESKRTVLQTLTEKNEQAKTAVEEIKKFKEDQSRLQRQIDTLEGLRKERLREVKILDNLQKDIPSKVWLTRIDLQASKLAISGLTAADTELSIFMEGLSKSIFLKQVNLVRSSEVSSETGTTKAFDISCDLETPIPAPANQTGGQR